MPMRWLLLFVFVVGCTDSSDPATGDTDPSPTDTSQEDSASPDAQPEGDASAADTEDPPDSEPDGVADSTDSVEADTPDSEPDTDAVDAEADAERDTDGGEDFELETQVPLEVREDPLAGSELQSCATIDATRCAEGVAQVCALVDPSTGELVREPDARLRRALLFDRWYDIYHHPDGQTAERYFSKSMPTGTPEAEWGDAEFFAGWGGAGDSAIWTGVALTAATLRYASTGTEAEYARMEDKVRRLLTVFDVTGIPGYLARYHYLMMPTGGPVSDEHILRYEGNYQPDHRDRPFDAGSVPDLSVAYTEGLPDSEGQLVVGQPMWQGNPSIDQYTGPRVGFSLAWDLLKDEELKARITEHLTCYLNRLERIEVLNLQDNPEAIDAFQGLLGSGALTLDEGDIDIGTIDTLVGYGLRQINSKNADDYPSACPSGPALEATRVYDAASPTFLLDLLALAQDLQSKDNESATGIDHFYVPSVRGGDAVHLMHLAAHAYHMTGEPQYLTFLEEVLIDDVRAVEVAYTLGAFDLPRWCKAFYGDHITFGPLWAFAMLLAPGEYRDQIAPLLHVEVWEKLMATARNAKFNLMYAVALDDVQGPARAQATAEGLASLDALGGNMGTLDEPRRDISVPTEQLLESLPEDIAVVCPTEAERAACEDGFNALGVELPGESIHVPCESTPSACPLEDGGCATPMASHGLPPTLRHWDDFMWQRNPFALGRSYALQAHRQSPGLDVSEVYWLAHYGGFVGGDDSPVLAWIDSDGDCPSE